MLITLTTDFGVSSPYVAAMKGSLLSVCRDVQLIGLTHAISPQDVRQAAVVLADVTPFFPTGTLHVVVVDPGVGTERRIIYGEIGEQQYLAPDNGVLSYLAKQSPPKKLIHLTERQFWRESISHTFHGRDIFAPVAGHLAAGVSPESLGSALDQMIELHWPAPEFSQDQIRGEVLSVDSFGNVITNIRLVEIRKWASGSEFFVSAGRGLAEFHGTYGDASPDTLIALEDSQGRLEIAHVNGNASSALGVSPGDRSVYVFRKR